MNKSLATKSNEKHEKYDLLAKVFVLGDSSVGKTCLGLRISEDKFMQKHCKTIGFDLRMKSMCIEGKKIKLQIWDTSGLEQFRSITKSYYWRANGIVLVYACNDRGSFSNIEKWMEEINQSVSERVCKIIIGNKCDAEDRVVSYDEGKTLADQYGIDFFETSAKDNVNIGESFERMAQKITEEFIFNERRNFSRCSIHRLYEKDLLPAKTHKQESISWLKKFCF